MPHLTAVSARLAAHRGVGQMELLDAADRAGLRVDAGLRRLWRELLGILASPQGYSRDRDRLAALLSRVGTVLSADLGTALAALYRQGHATAASALSRSLPRPWLEAALVRRLHEAEEGPPVVGATELTAVLFPPPSHEQVQAALAPFVRPADWHALGPRGNQRLPADLAAELAGRMSAGEDQRQVAQGALPYLDGSRVRARRAARTFGLHVAHRAQQDADLALGDLLAGWQVHAVLDEHTRPAHAARNGTVYYRHPQNGQPGLEQMPRPPLEADGSPAWNCRCWISPVLRPARAIAGDPAQRALFHDAAGKLIPDPAVYADWFSRASPALQRKAVGARRWHTVVRRHGGRPAWADFLDPERGGLLSARRLEEESATERLLRVGLVHAWQSRLGGLIRQVLMYGFLGEVGA